MSVIYERSMGGYTPTCDACGIRLCWDLSPEEYHEERRFWDSWKCCQCNPDYAGARKRWRAEQTISQ